MGIEDSERNYSESATSRVTLKMLGTLTAGVIIADRVRQMRQTSESRRLMGDPDALMLEILESMIPQTTAEFHSSFTVAKRIAGDLVDHAKRVDGGEVSTLLPHLQANREVAEGLSSAPNETAAEAILSAIPGVGDSRRARIEIKRVIETFNEIPLVVHRGLRELLIQRGYSVSTPTPGEMRSIVKDLHTNPDYRMTGHRDLLFGDLPGATDETSLWFPLRKRRRLGGEEVRGYAHAYRLNASPERIIGADSILDLAPFLNPDGRTLLVTLESGQRKKTPENSSSSLLAAMDDIRVDSGLAHVVVMTPLYNRNFVNGRFQHPQEAYLDYWGQTLGIKHRFLPYVASLEDVVQFQSGPVANFAREILSPTLDYPDSPGVLTRNSAVYTPDMAWSGAGSVMFTELTDWHEITGGTANEMPFIYKS